MKHVIPYKDQDGELIGEGTIEILPGFQCSLGWSHSAFIEPPHRGKGYGSKVHEARLDKAKELGYRQLLCSVRSDNVVQRHILAKHGWKKIHSFQTYCTTVELWVISLEERK